VERNSKIQSGNKVPYHFIAAFFVARKRERMNETGIRPVEYKVLVLIDQADEMTRGGLFVPPSSQETQQFKMQKATIIASGDMAFAEIFSEEERELAVNGARVLINSYAGSVIHSGDRRNMYRLLNDKDILAIIEKESEHGTD